MTYRLTCSHPRSLHPQNTYTAATTLLLLYVDEEGPAERTTIAASYRKAIRALINLSTSWQLASAALLSFDHLARSCLSEDEGPEQKTMLALTSPVVEEAKRQAGRPLPVSYELDFEAFLGMTGDIFFDSQSA